MKALLYCSCQNRMRVVDGVATCNNSACKFFRQAFQAPDLELKEVVPAEPTPASE